MGWGCFIVKKNLGRDSNLPVWHFTLIVSNGANLHEMFNPVFREKKKTISICRLLKILPRVLSVNFLVLWDFESRVDLALLHNSSWTINRVCYFLFFCKVTQGLIMKGKYVYLLFIQNVTCSIFFTLIRVTCLSNRKEFAPKDSVAYLLKLEGKWAQLCFMHGFCAVVASI